MLIAKTVDGRFFEVLRYGRVLFDDRPGWILVRDPGDPRMTNIRWVSTLDTKLEWLRVFHFEVNAF